MFLGQTTPLCNLSACVVPLIQIREHVSVFYCLWSVASLQNVEMGGILKAEVRRGRWILELFSDESQ